MLSIVLLKTFCKKKYLYDLIFDYTITINIINMKD